MVKGNSARRKELAARRRQDRKDEISRKKAGPSCATPIEARARILEWCSRSEANAIAWVAVETGKDVCEEFWRNGECRSKRCRLSHENSLSHLKCMPENSESTGSGNGEGAVVNRESQKSNSNSKRNSRRKGGQPKTSQAFHSSSRARGALPPMMQMQLHNVQAGGKLAYNAKVRTQQRQKSNLLFIEAEHTLVYDAFNPWVFGRWVASNTSYKIQSVAEELHDEPIGSSLKAVDVGKNERKLPKEE